MNVSNKTEEDELDPCLPLPEVPTMTLNTLEENGISTIDKLIQRNTRKLMQLRKFGKYGLRKLNTSLAKFDFSIRE